MPVGPRAVPVLCSLTQLRSNARPEHIRAIRWIPVVDLNENRDEGVANTAQPFVIAQKKAERAARRRGLLDVEGSNGFTLVETAIRNFCHSASKRRPST